MRRSELEMQHEARIQKEIERISKEEKSDKDKLKSFWKVSKHLSNRSLVQRNSRRIAGLKSLIRNANVKIGRLNRFYETKTKQYNEEIKMLKHELEDKIKIVDLITQGRRNETD